MMKRIYLAGFDVFRADALAHGELLKQACRRHGFIGVYPLDNAYPSHLSPRSAAQWIYEANLELIRHADLLMANLNNFRGSEPDSGTCFEIGFAKARHIPTWGYCTLPPTLLEQVPHQRSASGQCFDAAGYVVEDFGLSRNLMLSCSTRMVSGDVEDCLVQIVASEKHDEAL